MPQVLFATRLLYYPSFQLSSSSSCCWLMTADWSSCTCRCLKIETPNGYIKHLSCCVGGQYLSEVLALCSKLFTHNPRRREDASAMMISSSKLRTFQPHTLLSRHFESWIRRSHHQHPVIHPPRVAQNGAYFPFAPDRSLNKVMKYIWTEHQ